MNLMITPVLLSAMPHVSELATWPNLVLGLVLGGFVLWATMSAVAANYRAHCGTWDQERWWETR